jgi:thiol-disulfide isomerase/thioredoxin
MQFAARVLLRSLALCGFFALALPSALAAELLAVPGSHRPQITDRRLLAALAPHRGHPVVINVWASWCEPCREEMPALQRYVQRWQERGLAVITIAVADNATRARDFLWDIDVDLPVLDDHDQTLSRSLGARALPTTLVLDHRHRIRLRAQGVVDWASPGVDAQTQSLFKPSRETS